MSPHAVHFAAPTCAASPPQNTRGIRSRSPGQPTAGSRAGSSTWRNQTVKARRRLACAGSCNQATRAATTRCTFAGVRLLSRRNSAVATLRSGAHCASVYRPSSIRDAPAVADTSPALPVWARPASRYCGLPSGVPDHSAADVFTDFSEVCKAGSKRLRLDQNVCWNT